MIRIFVLWLLAVTPAALSYTNQIDLLSSESQQWTPAQRQLVEQASQQVSRRIHQAHIYSCAKRNSWRGIPSEQSWNQWMGPFRRQKQLTIAIEVSNLGPRKGAEATVGSARVGSSNQKVFNLAIVLNKEILERKRFAKRSPKKYWTKVIAHEIGHNLGLRHGTKSGATFEENYAGYFVTELGYCVMTDGQHGSAMGDAKVIHNRRLNSRKTGGHGW